MGNEAFYQSDAIKRWLTGVWCTEKYITDISQSTQIQAKMLKLLLLSEVWRLAR